MSGSARPVVGDPPSRSELADARTGAPTAMWRQWFDNVARYLGRIAVVTIPYDPPSIPAGDTFVVTLGVNGVQPGDFFTASFVPASVAVVVTADAIAGGQVAVRFTNTSTGAINPPAGNIFLEWRRRQ